MNKLSHAELHEAGLKAVPDGKGACQVCGKAVALRKDGIPRATHNRTIVHREADEHGPAITSWVECHGSRLPPVEYVAAREAAKNKG